MDIIISLWLASQIISVTYLLFASFLFCFVFSFYIYIYILISMLVAFLLLFILLNISLMNKKLFTFEAFSCGAYWRAPLKRVRQFFQRKCHKKSQYLLVVSLQIAIINCLYYVESIYSRTATYFHCVIHCLIVL